MEILLGLVWGAALFYFMTLLHSLQIFSLVMLYCMCICILYVYRAKVMPCFFNDLISSVCLLRYGVRGDTRGHICLIHTYFFLFFFIWSGAFTWRTKFKCLLYPDEIGEWRSSVRIVGYSVQSGCDLQEYCFIPFILKLFLSLFMCLSPTPTLTCRNISSDYSTAHFFLSHSLFIFICCPSPSLWLGVILLPSSLCELVDCEH